MEMIDEDFKRLSFMLKALLTSKGDAIDALLKMETHTASD